jgi:hypothetical protein
MLLRRSTLTPCDDSTQSLLNNYVESETTVVRKRVQEAEKPITQEQANVRNYENA